MKKVAMLGAGSWGTALSLVLADNGHQVMMWGHRAELIDQINELHENKDYLPGVELSSSIIGEQKSIVSGCTAEPFSALPEWLLSELPQ
jgi:glycerol-3-phosphate dehydrogenase